MRIILMYDLPFLEVDDTKKYHKFHNKIISRGYVMMQYSVYVRAINSPTKKNLEIQYIKRNLPTHGNIRILVITDKQYYDMFILKGHKGINETINTEKRRVKIYE